MKLRKYTLDELKETIKTSTSIRQVLLKLNLSGKGGSYATFHKAVKYYNLDTSHFTGQDTTGMKLPLRRKPITEYLINGSTIQSHKLKKYFYILTNRTKHKLSLFVGSFCASTFSC